VIDVDDNGSVPRLVIFDLDGTLYPREQYAEQVLAVIGRGFVELRGTTPGYAEEKVAELRARMRADWSGTSTTSFMIGNGSGVEEWRDYREANLSIADGVRPDGNVVRALERLRSVVPIVLLSNNTRGSAKAILDRIGVGVGGFTDVLTAEDVGETPKPNPEAFRVLLSRFELDARHAWSVGDRYDIDIRGLRELGGAGITVDGPADLPAAVDVLIAKVAPDRG
jgi:FMN phosphatase YigB (HAD superfamily)